MKNKIHLALLASAMVPAAAFAQTNDLEVEQQKFQAAYEQGLTGAGVSIGVLDDGVDYRFSGMKNSINFDLSKDFGSIDGNPRNSIFDSLTAHGTPVASVIIANGDIKGFAPGANIVVLRGDHQIGSQHYSHITEHTAAIKYATDIGLKIINRSYSLVQNAEFEAAVTAFSSSGGLIINSAGNEGLRATPVFDVTDEIGILGSLLDQLNSHGLINFA